MTEPTPTPSEPTNGRHEPPDPHPIKGSGVVRGGWATLRRRMAIGIAVFFAIVIAYGSCWSPEAQDSERQTNESYLCYQAARDLGATRIQALAACRPS